MTDQELKDFIAKFAISVDENQANYEKRWTESQAKNDKMLAESRADYEKRWAESRAKNDKMLAESRASYDKMQAESQAKNDKMWAELKDNMKANDETLLASMKANDDKLTRVGVRLGNIQQNNGDIAEEYFYKTVERTMKLGDVSFDLIDRSVSRHIKKSQLQGEYDIVLVNGKSVAFIETKYKMHEKDVIKIKEKMIPTFKKLYSEYKDLKLFAGIASFHISKNVKNLAKEFGFYVLEKKGNVMQTNSENVISY